MAQFADKWILMGDYNLTACEGAVCELVSNGTVYNMDDPFCSSTLPATRGDKRRIDYGLCCKHLHPVAVDHTRGISDHVAVRYQFDFEADFLGHIGPCHARKAVDPSLIPSLFAEARDESAFNVALQTEQVDDAWHFLSCAAEKALFSDCGTVQPRSHAWTPRPQRKHSKAAAASESLPLVRLCRCVRRIKQLGFQPGDVHLRDKIARDISGLVQHFPHLAELDHFTVETQVPFAEQVLEDATASERRNRLSQWQESVSSRLSKQSTWIKRKSNSALALDSAASTYTDASQVQQFAVHPVQQIRQEEEVWLLQWSADPAVHSAEHLDNLRNFLEGVQPSLPTFPLQVQWTVTALQRVARTMVGKAAGPDHWTSDSLLLLPDAWWSAFAQLWDLIFLTSLGPTRWNDARISLLPKPSGDLRPLSLVTVCWRIGAKHLVKCLRPSVSSWITPNIFGGVPNQGLLDAHTILWRAILDDDGGDVAFISQDLSKFFDSISLPHLQVVLAHCGALQQFNALVTSFYNQARRVFSSAGFLGAQWHTVSRGLVQGCPLSPLLSAILMNIWGRHVAGSGARTLSFVDDRTF